MFILVCVHFYVLVHEYLKQISSGEVNEVWNCIDKEKNRKNVQK